MQNTLLEVLDFKKDPTYRANKQPEVVTIPKMTFIMVDGAGAPESNEVHTSEFQEAMGILFGVVYTIKFWDKKHNPPSRYAKFTMPPVEALWWMQDGSPFDTSRPEDWRWTAMLRVPDFVQPGYFKAVINDLVASKRSDIYRRARLETFDEGTCVQLMHVGPYDTEGPNIERLHAFASEAGYLLYGKHHELYFNDPRRTAPEKLKTIIRQPVTR